MRRQSELRRGLRALVWIVPATAGLLAASSRARAAIYTVDRIDDTAAATACGAAPNDCSLRGAILAANAHPGPDTIVLQAGATYKLTIGPSDSGVGQIDATHGDLDVTDDLTINGNGATIDAAGLDRVFDVQNAALTPFTVTMSDLTITGGVARGFLSAGGGINVRAATLNLVRCTVTGNSTFDGISVDNGGGIAANGVLFPAVVVAHLNLTDSAVTNNKGGNGGGIVCGSCALELDHSIVIGNMATAALGGGGVFATGAGSTVQITNQTVVSNNVSVADGGGIALFTAQLTMADGGISGNHASKGGGGIFNSPISPGSMVLTGSALTGNIADGVGAGMGGGIFNGGGTLTMHFCRISGNIFGGAPSGVVNAGGVADVTDDWWGCNAGPAGAQCDGVAGAAFAPWLTLGLTATLPVVVTGQVAQVTADLTRNSSGTDTSGLGHIADGTPLTFTATHGTVAPPMAGTLGGRATSTFTGDGTAGTASASVALDHQTASVLFVVNPDPTTVLVVLSNLFPPDDQSIGVTAIVSADAPGSGTPEGHVQFKQDGSPLGVAIALVGGQAATTVGPLPIGSHTITADYGGEPGYKPGSGSAMAVAVRPGDLNGDGVVDVHDITLMIQILLGEHEPTAQERSAGDTRPRPGIGGLPYGDGRLAADDLNWLFRRFLGLETAP